MTDNGGDQGAIIILVTRAGMGSADPELQHKLLKSYLTLIDEGGLNPAAICFYGEGVKMTVTGSPVLDQLRALESRGIYLLLCGTCLNHYHLADQVEVGIVGGMTDVIEAQRRAEKVITI